jgi:hypothetical protein
MGGQKERAAGDLMRCGPESFRYVKSGGRTRTMADGTTIASANDLISYLLHADHSASPSTNVRSMLRRGSI